MQIKKKSRDPFPAVVKEEDVKTKEGSERGNVAGFENGGRKPLEAEKSKETDSALEPSEDPAMPSSWFQPVRCLSDF